MGQGYCDTKDTFGTLPLSPREPERQRGGERDQRECAHESMRASLGEQKRTGEREKRGDNERDRKTKGGEREWKRER